MAVSKHVDLEDIVLRWAQIMFKTTSKNSKALAKLAEEDLQFKVDWRRVHFKHSKPEFKDTAVPDTPGSQVLFQTEFTNRTNQEQEYAFKAERATRSTCDIVVERGVTLGTELSMKLATPCEVFEANAGFHREVSVNNAFGECVEEELVWSVDNTIKVPSRHRAHAQLVISEGKYDARFIVNSSAAGEVRVVITNTKDNNSYVQEVKGDVAEIVRNANPKGVNIDKRMVRWDTEGTCNFRYGIKQFVDVSQEELD